MGTDLDRLDGAIGYLLVHGMNGMAAEIRAAIAELAELRARPAIPPWSRGRPTEPGWYWAMGEGRWTGDPVGPFVVEASRNEWTGDFTISGLHSTVDVEFSGPICVPDGPRPVPPGPEPKGGEP